MSTSNRTYRCNHCNGVCKRDELTFKSCYIYATASKEKDVHGRNVLMDPLSVKAWRYLCTACVSLENKHHKIHIEANNGRVMKAGSDDWVKFVKEYEDISEHYGLGKGFDDLKQHSPWLRKDDNRNLKYGKTKDLSVFGFFTIKQNHDVNDEKEDEIVYDTAGCAYSEKELETLLNFMKSNKYEQIMRRGEWFKEQGLPRHMKDKQLPCRKPTSYDALLTRLSKSLEQQKPHKLLKNNKRLNALFKEIMDGIDKAQKEKYNMDTTKNSSVDAARNGLFSKDLRQKKKGKPTLNGNDIIAKGLKQHGQNFKNKKWYNDERLKISREQTQCLQSIGNNFKFVNMTLDDWFGDLNVFISIDYTPEDKKKSVMDIISMHKPTFSALWGSAMRRWGDGDIDKKVKLINDQCARYSINEQ